jgi:hypothetical protein
MTSSVVLNPDTTSTNRQEQREICKSGAIDDGWGEARLRGSAIAPIGGLAPFPHGVAGLDQKLGELRTDFVRTSDFESAYVQPFDEPVGGKRNDSDPDDQLLSSATA